MALPSAAAPAQDEGPHQELVAGLSAQDWSGIRAAREADRHAALPAERGYRAHNPSQRWETLFDARGFTTLPDGGGWSWGLELLRYGYPGEEIALQGRGCLEAEGPRVTNRHDDSLLEWYVNGERGLEHGFTVLQRPAGCPQAETDWPLRFRLAVRGELKPCVERDGRDVRFLDSSGTVQLTYSGLTVFDADGATLPSRFEADGTELRLSVDDRGARYPLTIDPIAQQAYLKASNTGAGDRFGASVAISGDTVVVGASFEDSDAAGVDGDGNNNNATDSGAAYVFVRNGSSWSQQAFLKASNTGAFDRFGYAVSVSGDTVVVGAIGEGSSATGIDGDQSDNSAGYSGAVYVFVRNGSSWSQQAYLKASNSGMADTFGNALSLSGDTLVVGASSEDSDATGVNGDGNNDNAFTSGAAYVFVRNGSSWSQQAFLKASNTESDDFFGVSVAVSGDTVVVSAPGESSGATGVNGNQADNSATYAGAAYVFVRSGSSWSQQAYLKASDIGAFDEFGASVSASGDTVAVGASGEDSSATGVDGDDSDNSAGASGAVYVFVRNGSSWSQQAYLKASGTGAGDQFGNSVLVLGDTAVIGAFGEDSNATGVNGNQADNSLIDPGAVYLFARNGTTWSQQAYLKASNPGFDDYFGASVSLSGSVLVVGALGEDSNATGVNGNQGSNSAGESGAAYVFDLEDPVTSYCAQTLPTSVPGCFASLSVSDPSLATGSWDTTSIPRSATISAGNSLGIYIFTHGVGLGQSAVSTTVPFGALCLQGFKRSAPLCAPVTLATLPGQCSGGVMSLPVGCNSGALGVSVGDDVNVQLWYRDPTSSSAGQARFSNAVFYTVL